MAYYWGSVIVLAAALFFPVSRLIWVLSARRLSARMDRELSEQELRGQRRRARWLAAPVCLIFSALFTFQLLKPPVDG